MSTAAKLRPDRAASPWLLFLGFSVSVSALASWIAHIPHARLVATAAGMDLTLTVPACWYWLMVRPGLRSKTTVAFVGLLGLWRASFLFPEIVPGKLWIGACIELTVVAALVASLRSARRTLAAPGDADPMDRFRQAVERLIYPKTRPANNGSVSFSVKAVASELSVCYYGFAWKAKPHVPAGNRAFSLHQRSGNHVLIGCLGVLSLMEIVVVHLALHKWSAGAAWILTGLGLWGAVWMLALSRGFGLRPTLVHRDGLVVRFGLLFRLVIPADKILSIESGGAAPAETRVVPRGSSPSVYIRFTEPLEAEFIAGLTKRLEAIALSTDDDSAFQSALASLNKTT